VRAPARAEARVLRARALTRLQRPTEAADEWSRVTPLLRRPTPDHYVERARAIVEAGEARLGEAVALLDEGILRLGPAATLDLLAIELDLRRGRPEAALARVDRQATAAPRHEGWLMRRGEILEQAGRPAEARAAYAAALGAVDALPEARRRARAVEEVRQRSADGLARTGASAPPTHAVGGDSHR